MPLPCLDSVDGNAHNAYKYGDEPMNQACFKSELVVEAILDDSGLYGVSVASSDHLVFG